MAKAKNYKEHLLKQLQKPEEAAAYLNAALHDDDPHVFLLALRDTAEAKRATRDGLQMKLLIPK
jgi:DNA-binding phage protein